MRKRILAGAIVLFVLWLVWWVISTPEVSITTVESNRVQSGMTEE